MKDSKVVKLRNSAYLFPFPFKCIDKYKNPSEQTIYQGPKASFWCMKMSELSPWVTFWELQPLGRHLVSLSSLVQDTLGISHGQNKTFPREVLQNLVLCGQSQVIWRTCCTIWLAGILRKTTVYPHISQKQLRPHLGGEHTTAPGLGTALGIPQLESPKS